MIKNIKVESSLPGEEWVQYYDRKISSFGRFIKVDSHKNELYPKYGSPRQKISINGTGERIYRIVCEIWHPKTKEDIELGRDYVDHIDGDPNNNKADNLRWCTCKENLNFPLAKENYRKREWCCKKIVCKETKIIYSSMNEASRKTGIPSYMISRCCRGIIKSANNLHWEYV